MAKAVWTEETEARFLSALRRLRNVDRACEEVGVGRRGAYKRRAAHEAFASAWDRALAAPADSAVNALEEILQDAGASPEVKVRAAQALHVRQRFADRPWGTGVAEKAQAKAEAAAPAPAELSPAMVTTLIEAGASSMSMMLVTAEHMGVGLRYTADLWQQFAREPEATRRRTLERLAEQRPSPERDRVIARATAIVEGRGDPGPSPDARRMPEAAGEAEEQSLSEAGLDIIEAPEGPPATRGMMFGGDEDGDE